MKGSFQRSIFLYPTDSTEVLDIVKELKHCSSGYDDISTQVVQQSVHSYTDVLVHFINLSFFPKS